jgi:fatty acid desaturase
LADVPRIEDYLTPEQIGACLRRSDWQAVRVLAVNYLMIVGAFALAIAWPNPLTILLSVLILGGRQLGMEVLVHDCAHSVFFTRRRVNEIVGHWLCGGLVNTSLYRYRDYHLGHHRYAGTDKDPDLYLAQMYPAPRDSMRRKLLRDVSGRTGIRDTWRQLRVMRLGRNAPFLAFHAVMIVALAAAGALWAYLLWWAAYLFVYPLLTRVRYMGEHGVCMDHASADPRENTSSTLASWWERLLVAPNRVNFHLEHHLLASVPLYHLPKMQRLLRVSGFYGDKDCFSHGYLEVVRKATVPAA